MNRALFIIRYTLQTVAVLALAFGSPVHADDAIALESYPGERPPDADRILGSLRAALASRGVVVKPADVLSRVGADLPLAGNPDRDITRTDLLKRIETGIYLAAHEKFDEAIVVLESVLRDVDNNPALSASDPRSRTWVTKARVGLAFAYSRSGKQKLANQVIVGHVRSYPDISLMGEQEEVEKLYEENMAIIKREPRGKLIFRVNLHDATIFVDDVRRGDGDIELAAVPGEHRIVVRAEGIYRRYKVTMQAGQTVERSIDWSVDAAFTGGPDWVGLAAPPESHRAVETFFQELAQRRRSTAVVMIGIVKHDGRRYVVAKPFSAGSASARPGRAIEVDRANDARVELLARYVTARDVEAAKADSAGLMPIPGNDGARSVKTGAQPPTVAVGARGEVQREPARWPVLAATGVFGLSLPLGAYFLKLRNDCYSGNCSRLTVTGWSLLGVGGVALGFGAVWLVRVERAGARRAATLDLQPLPGGGMASVSGRF